MSGWVDEGPRHAVRCFDGGLRAVIKPVGTEVMVRVLAIGPDTRLVAYAPTLAEAKQHAEAFVALRRYHDLEATSR